MSSWLSAPAVSICACTATRFDYDELGNQLTQTDANNHATRYTYDNAGRRVTRTLPLGQQELLGYDGGQKGVWGSERGQS